MPIFRSLSILMVVAILINAMAPALAYAATYLQGAEVNANTLVRDAYVAVRYHDSNGKRKLEKGWIYAIDETTFEIRSRAIFGKETIAYDKVLSVIMSEESTTPIKQINEVDRFMRKREIEQAKQDREQAAYIGLTKYDTRVRVQAPSIQKRRIIGRLVKMTQDTLVIQRGRTFFQVSRSDISSFEVNIGQHRNTDKGMKFGFALGLGILVPVAIADAREGGELQGLPTFFTAIYVSLPICILSTLIGAATKSNTWVKIPPQHFNLSLVPTSTKGLHTALTFNF